MYGGLAMGFSRRQKARARRAWDVLAMVEWVAQRSGSVAAECMFAIKAFEAVEDAFIDKVAESRAG